MIECLQSVANVIVNRSFEMSVRVLLLRDHTQNFAIFSNCLVVISTPFIYGRKRVLALEYQHIARWPAGFRKFISFRKVVPGLQHLVRFTIIHISQLPECFCAHLW